MDVNISRSERYQTGDFTFDRISYGNMRSMHVIAPANAKLSRPEIHRDDYEMCWVLKGKIKFSLPNETYILSGGDSIQFDALLTHNYETLENSEILIVHIKKGKRF